MAIGMAINLFFNLIPMLILNLPIIAASRALYILAYYFNYVKHAERDPNVTYSFTRREKIYFVGKNIAVILLGFLNIYVALFFAVYSLLCAGIYLKNVGTRKKDKRLENFGKNLYVLTPIGFGIAFLLRFDFIAIVVIVASYILFINWGRKYAELSYTGLIERYEKRLFLRIPISVQYGIILLVIVPVVVLIILAYSLNFLIVDVLVALFVYLFNPFNLVAVNLLIILVSRMLYIWAYRLNYYKYAERGSENLKLALFSRNKKLYFITLNGIIILLGFLFIYVALFVAIYSLLVAAIYFRNVKAHNSLYDLIGSFCYVLIPLSIIYAMIFYWNPIGIIPIIVVVILTIPLYIYTGQKYSKFSLKEILQNFNQKYAKRTKSVLQYFILGYIIILPIIFIIGISLSYPYKEDYMVEMRDGANLATSVYYAPGIGKYGEAPVVLIRTPYNKDAMGMEFYAALYLSQGYHVVFQDMRNCFASDGEKEDLLFISDHTDGVDTIEWILKQDWCNGKIATSGASALSINTFLFAGMKDAYDGDDGLKCQLQMFGFADLYEDGAMEGAFRYDLIVNWVKSTAPRNYRYQLNTLFDLINSQDTDAYEYKVTTLKKGVNKWENVNCRALHVAGWYDVFLGGALKAYMGYDDNGTRYARGHQRLIIGPWQHGLIFTPVQAEITYPENALGISKIFEWEREIFDEGLRGIPADWSEDNVMYYLMGDPKDKNANYWKTAPDWPLDYTPKKWYFGMGEDGEQLLVKDIGDLTNAKNYSYDYDPRDPCPTIGGNNLGGSGPQDQNSLIDREDTLVFTSEELKKAYTFEGDIRVKLFFKSNCNDTDFMVRLCDVYPDGRTMLIIDGARMARLRKSMYHEDFLNSSTPEKEYNITINLFSTAYRFDEGHRIRIIISSSNFPRYAVNPNTGAPLGTDDYAELKVAQNTIITGIDKSYITLPELN